LSSFSAWGAFTTCPYKLRQKQFFSALGGAPTAPPWGAPTAPPGYAYGPKAKPNF